MKTKFFLIVLGLQAAWVVATAAIHEIKLRDGTLVLLETAPVDPRDSLRGDYLTLGYKLNTLPQSLFLGGVTNSPAEGTPVYVRLMKNGDFYVAEKAALTPLLADRSHPVLRGKTTWGWNPWNGTNGSVRVNYGLERFYVHEGTGNPKGKLTAEVAIPDSGDGILRQVYIDGKPYREVMAGGNR